MINPNKSGLELLQEQLHSWSHGLATEVHFWSAWVASGGGHWPDDFCARLDPTTPIREYIARMIARLGKGSVQILDVGCGPITNIGYISPVADVHITAVDPLSDAYSKLLARHNLNPPKPTQFAIAEDLSVFFDKETFDIVHCCNALDHSIDPMRGLREMVHVTRLGGSILMLHHENEADMENYAGMHQHNFTVRDGRFVIWNRDGEIDVADSLGSGIEIEACLYGETLSALVKRGVSVTIHKVGREVTQSGPDPFRARLAQVLEAIVRNFAQDKSN